MQGFWILSINRLQKSLITTACNGRSNYDLNHSCKNVWCLYCDIHQLSHLLLQQLNIDNINYILYSKYCLCIYLYFIARLIEFLLSNKSIAQSKAPELTLTKPNQAIILIYHYIKETASNFWYYIDREDTTKGAGYCLSSKIIHKIEFFTYTPKANFYDKLFLNMDLSNLSETSKKVQCCIKCLLQRNIVANIVEKRFSIKLMICLYLKKYLNSYYFLDKCLGSEWKNINTHINTV